MGTPPKSAAFTNYDLTDQVTSTVIKDLKKGLPHFERVLAQRGFNPEENYLENPLIRGQGVYRGVEIRINEPAAIRVRVVGKTPTWQATRVRDDTYKFNIDCLSKVTTKPEVIDEFIDVLSSSVANYIIRFSNLQPQIDGTSPPIRAYNSFIDSIEFGYQQGGAYRAATIPYWIKIMNPYVMIPDLVGEDC